MSDTDAQDLEELARVFVDQEAAHEWWTSSDRLVRLAAIELVNRTLTDTPIREGELFPCAACRMLLALKGYRMLFTRRKEERP